MENKQGSSANDIWLLYGEPDNYQTDNWIPFTYTEILRGGIFGGEKGREATIREKFISMPYGIIAQIEGHPFVRIRPE